MSEKLDGMRALWLGNCFVSRTGKPIHAPRFFMEGLPNHVTLDGELFAGRGKFSQTVSIARRKDGGEDWGLLRFQVFDAPSVDGHFRERLDEAERVLTKARYASVLPHTPCRSNQQLHTELRRIEHLNGEGVMMRLANSRYTHGRSRELLKVKSFKDDEALVVGHIRGKGKHCGRLGALACRLRTGKVFKIGSGFSDDERAKPPSLNSVVTFRFFETTAKGVPRFPTYMRVREDVDPNEFV